MNECEHDFLHSKCRKCLKHVFTIVEEQDATIARLEEELKKKRMMDWAVEQEWWNSFVENRKLVFIGMWVRGEINGPPINPESKFISYLWRNLPDLIDEYRREK